MMKGLVTRGLPLFAFALLAVLLLRGLFSDPNLRDSELLGRLLPEFSLPDLMDKQTTHGPALFDGEMTLLNVWGVWCTTCKVELPYLTSLREQGVRIVGLYYKQDIDPSFDRRPLTELQRQVKQTLINYSNPFLLNIYDHNRDLSFDLGVTGAPETFLIGPQRQILAHHVGDINPRVWSSVFAPYLTPAASNELSSLSAVKKATGMDSSISTQESVNED